MIVSIDQGDMNATNADAIVAQILADNGAVRSLVEPLPDEVAAIVVELLKAEADRQMTINANRSLEVAEKIVQIGRARNDLRHTALGMMARGNAVMLLGRNQEAWELFDVAGSLFLDGGDAVGWARTRIGKLGICLDLNRVAEAMADAERARAIFVQQRQHTMQLRLDTNAAVVYDLLGDQQKALALYQSALTMAQALGTAGQEHLGPLYLNIGYAYNFLGDFRQAEIYYDRARAIFSERGETSAVAATELNLAYLKQAQGQYRYALKLLHHAHALMASEQLPLDAAKVRKTMVECYLQLNRYQEARDLAVQAIQEFRNCEALLEEALTLLHLATAEAELKNGAAARAALDSAETIFLALGTFSSAATARLRRGRLALQEGDYRAALREASDAGAQFMAAGRQIDYAAAALMRGQCLFACNDFRAAAEAVAICARIAQRCNIPALRYGSHLLLGRIAEAHGDIVHARRRFHAAAATVERVQRRLTITLRPGFLEDKGEALRALINLHLRAGTIDCAFLTLERAKSQVWLSHLANRDQVRWTNKDPHSQALQGELHRLRAEYQWFYNAAHAQVADPGAALPAVTPAQAQEEIAVRERRMRSITEQLYLSSSETDNAGHVFTLALSDVQRTLDQETLLIEFYNDGTHVWAFTLCAQRLEVHQIPLSVAAIDQLLAQFQVTIAAALQASVSSAVTAGLTKLTQRLLHRLYTALIAPFSARLQQRRRLIFVPYGALHYLPFHLLHTGSGYLIEQYEVVVLPAAGLATRKSLPTRPGALVLAHSWGDRLPQTQAEAGVVQRIFGGELYREQDAGRNRLESAPAQILHIAAHGEHRLDNPDLSYIQLHDGQMYTDDLLQHDLSYELVTLSACETGRAKVAAGDELIGLGRGFLYAGAGALIASLWRVADDITVTLMELLYAGLASGASKAAALRGAQHALHSMNPNLHPAFWGAFQLVGDARPLSTYAEMTSRKEQTDVTITATA